MVKSFACRDIGMSCDFTASAETEQKLMDKITKHAREAHKMRKIDSKMMSTVKAAIVDKG